MKSDNIVIAIIISLVVILAFTVSAALWLNDDNDKLREKLKGNTKPEIEDYSDLYIKKDGIVYLSARCKYGCDLFIIERFTTNKDFKIDSLIILDEMNIYVQSFYIISKPITGHEITWKQNRLKVSE